MDSKGTQPYIHMHPSSPKPPAIQAYIRFLSYDCNTIKIDVHVISNTRRQKQQFAVGSCFYSTSIVSFNLKTIALLNRSQGDMGLQGPDGIPPDNGYVEKPTPVYELLPEQYKVKGCSKTDVLPFELTGGGEKDVAFFGLTQTVAFRVETLSPPN